MTGSLFWFQYASDTAQIYNVLVDKSNANATCAGANLMIPRIDNSGEQLPRAFKMRYANAYLQSNPAIKRRFWIGSVVAQTNAAATGATIVSSEGTWIVTSLRGEKRRSVPAFDAPDTGQVA